jgi:PAS domain S-box-containing protein
MISNHALLKIFKSSNSSCIILSPDAPYFTTAEVNASYLKNFGKKESDSIGKSIFKMFANVVEKNDDSDNNFNLRQSLNTVIQTRALHKMDAQKFHICIDATGEFEERYWDIENAPILNDQSEIEYIIQTITDVTQNVLSRKDQLSENERPEGLSDQGFKSLIYNSVNLIGVIDEDSKYKYASPSFFTILGIDPNELIGNTSGEYIHPEDKELVLSSYAKLKTSKKIKIPPFRFKHKNGTWRWLETIVNDLRNDPSVNGIVTNSIDVTERIETERELKNSEEKYKLLFQFSPVPKWFYDLDSYKILDVNKSAIDHYGYSREEFLNMTIEDIRPEEELPKLLQARKRIKSRKGLVHFGTFIHHKKDGTRIKVEVSGHRFDYNQIDSMMVACVDVTERENALHQLREDGSKLLAAQKIARLGYWQLKLDGNTLYWSDEVYNILGVNKKTFQTSFDSFLETVHPDDRDGFLKSQSIALGDVKEVYFKHGFLLSYVSVSWILVCGKLVY